MKTFVKDDKRRVYGKEIVENQTVCLGNGMRLLVAKVRSKYGRVVEVNMGGGEVRSRTSHSVW